MRRGRLALAYLAHEAGVERYFVVVQKGYYNGNVDEYGMVWGLEGHGCTHTGWNHNTSTPRMLCRFYGGILSVLTPR